MQLPFGIQIGIHKWYLGKMGGVGYLRMLGFSFTFDLIVSLAQAKVEINRKVECTFHGQFHYFMFVTLVHVNINCMAAQISKILIQNKSRF